MRKGSLHRAVGRALPGRGSGIGAREIIFEEAEVTVSFGGLSIHDLMLEPLEAVAI
jgi:hypothetical protein